MFTVREPTNRSVAFMAALYCLCWVMGYFVGRLGDWVWGFFVYVPLPFLLALFVRNLLALVVVCFAAYALVHRLVMGHWDLGGILVVGAFASLIAVISAWTCQPRPHA